VNGEPTGFDPSRYLAAKKTVDDRAINRQVLADLRRLLPTGPLRAFEAQLGGYLGRLREARGPGARELRRGNPAAGHGRQRPANGIAVDRAGDVVAVTPPPDLCRVEGQRELAPPPRLHAQHRAKGLGIIAHGCLVLDRLLAKRTRRQSLRRSRPD
jgi:hypothetical protein